MELRGVRESVVSRERIVKKIEILSDLVCPKGSVLSRLLSTKLRLKVLAS